MRCLLPLTVVLAFIGFSCRSNLPTPPSSKNVQLQLEDVTATEAWLRMRLIDGVSAPTTVSRNGKVILSLAHPPADTVIADDALLPRQTYLYTITRSTLFGFGESSTLDVTTMDTTGHQMVWEVDTLGDGPLNSSAFLDVAILNDTLAYAVGQIFLNDSSGRIDPTAYSLAVWNGSYWRPKRLYYAPNRLVVPIRGIFPSNSQDIWLAAGSIYRWDGVSSQAQLTFSRLDLPNPNATLEKGERLSNPRMLAVGNSGTIIEFDGNNWSRIEGGTDIDLVDLCSADGTNVWIAGLDRATYQQSLLLQYNGSQFRTAYVYDPAFQNLRRQDSITGIVTSVYADTKHSLWVTTSSGEYYCPSNTKGEGKLSWAPDYLAGFTRAVRGDAPNNVFLAGDYTTLVHFNGYSWHHYRELMRLWDNSAADFYAVAVKGTNVFAVGQMNGYAVVYRGRRIN